MSRRTPARIQFDALTLEGGLLPAEWLGRVAALDAPAQAPTDYGVPKGLQLRDEIGRYWRIAEALWAEFASGRTQPGHDAAGAARAFIRQLLTEVLGFGELAPGGEVEAGGRRFPVTFQALGGRVPVYVGAPGERLDDAVMRHGDGVRRRSAWGALQEYLNAAEDALWGLASNGLLIRLGRDNASLTRPAWLEADLERIFADGLFADFSALWLVLHASRFGRADQPVDAAPLEAWRAAGREEGSRAREQLRKGVEAALRELGQGFVAHVQNTALRDALASGALTPGEYFNELLRLVYRMIFLLTVEEREIVHAEGADAATRALYREGYGMRRLRDRAVRSTQHDRHGDLWASLLPVFAGLGRAGGEPALGLPGLGGLFAPEQCPTLDACALDNRSLLVAVFRLAWLREPGALSRVNWKDMGPEELGSVYESLLELVPRVSTDAREFGFAGAAESAGNTRKLTGSYYTPDALVQQLLDTALEPVVAQRLAAHPENLADALLSISVIDPACGSGHFLLAAARRLAGHLARAKAGGTPGAAEYRHALREVVTHCIYGVDRNPMALELARMALWLEAFSPDRALGFLDHHLVCGDALLGLMDLSAVRGGIPDEAFKALTGDDKEVAKALAKRNRDHRKALTKADDGQYAIKLTTGALGEAFDALDALEDPDVDAYEAKRRRFLELHSAADESPAALAADCFLAAFLSPKRSDDDLQRVPTSRELLFLLEGSGRVSSNVAAHARKICREARVLHWPLAFPQVFEDGGFEVVLGNPPWEVSQFSEEEYFATRDPGIAALPGNRRKSAIAALQQDAPDQWDAYTAEKRYNEATNATHRGTPRFALSAIGKLNTYALFTETAYYLTRAPGRAGIVVPTGIATDDSTKALFGRMIETSRLVSLLACYEIRRWFPGTDDRKSFCLLTIGGASSAEFAFQLMNASEFRESRKFFHLSAAELALLNPNTKTAPLFRSQTDADLAKAIYRRIPILIEQSPSGEINRWNIEFSQGLFNLTSDSARFETERGSDALPLYEGKMIHQFDHRWSTYGFATGPDNGSFDVSVTQKADPAFVVQPRYWVSHSDVEAELRPRGWNYGWLIGWRDIALISVERTVIASVLPRVGVGHTLPLFFAKATHPQLLAALLANFNSLVVDYIARLKIGGTHLTYTYLKQLPILPPDHYKASNINFIKERVLELTYTACDMTPWARDLGYEGPPFRWDPDRRALLRAELDAYYARLYGLTRDELRYILDPADVMGPDYPSETFRVLKDNEMRAHGEYRTRRLVLEAWDRMFGD
jgi:hypothetical protein